MKPRELLALLQDFYRDKLALKVRHEAGAELMPAYEFNNTYQYVINRDDLHLQWVAAAIEALGGAVPASAPELSPPSRGRDAEAMRATLSDDAGQEKAFQQKWRERVERVTHARDRTLLQVILGETLEHTRFFEQALAGRLDLLGRRDPSASTGGGVLAKRWRGHR